MLVALTPTVIRLAAISATTSGMDMAPGAPDALTLMPTKSALVKNRAQLSRGSRSPVSDVMPLAIMVRTVGTSTRSVAFSTAASGP
jgi:hypothetical protein